MAFPLITEAENAAVLKSERGYKITAFIGKAAPP